MPTRYRRIRRWWMTKFFDGLNDSAVAGLSSTPMSFVIRCATPDCDWGYRIKLRPLRIPNVPKQLNCARPFPV